MFYRKYIDALLRSAVGSSFFRIAYLTNLNTAWGVSLKLFVMKSSRNFISHFPSIQFFNLYYVAWIFRFCNRWQCIWSCWVSIPPSPPSPPPPQHRFFQSLLPHLAAQTSFLRPVALLGTTSPHIVVTRLPWRCVMPSGSWMSETPPCCLIYTRPLKVNFASTSHGNNLNIQLLRGSSRSMNRCTALISRECVSLIPVVTKQPSLPNNKVPFKFHRLLVWTILVLQTA